MTFGLEPGKGGHRYDEFLNKWVYIDTGSTRPIGLLKEIDLKSNSFVLSPFVAQDYHGTDLPLFTRIDEGRKVFPLGDYGMCAVPEEVILRSVEDCRIEFDAQHKIRKRNIKKLEEILDGKRWWRFWK